MKRILIKYGIAMVVAVMGACSDSNDTPEEPIEPNPDPVATGESVIVCNEGNWQSDNGQLSYYDGSTGTFTNQWFRQVNGYKLGDTPNCIIQVNDTLIAIAVNWSNIVQYIHPDGTACGATENVPNNRKMCTDGKYIYLTSYAHICGSETFEKGYVAKIDVATKKVVATCEVGWEPEGIKLYNGKLFIGNSGGYAYSETHHYETTLSVVDASTMQLVKTIDTGCINLYGGFAQAGKYLCINSGGDYYENDPATIILDCDTYEFTVLPFPSTASTSDGTLFYTVGTAFSYITYEYAYYLKTINPATLEMQDMIYTPEITDLIKSLQSPYDIYVSPYTENLYFTDARSYATAGYLYGYSREGEQLFAPQKAYINPAHVLAVKI